MARVALFLSRHTGRDSRQAILPDALRVNANLFPTDWCRTNSPGANWDVRSTGRSPSRKEAVSNPDYRDVSYASPPWPLDSGTPCRNDDVLKNRRGLLESSGKRHTSRDCWYPDYREVGINCHPWPVDSCGAILPRPPMG
jgi:hypothetical protein